MSASRVSCRVLLVWACLVLVCLMLYSRPGVDSLEPASVLVAPVDALVFIAASDMAADPVVDFSIASSRKGGRWKGPIFVLTDHPHCFQNAEQLDVQVVEIPPQPDILHIKALKTQLFDHLPAHINSVLYLDADVIVAHPLGQFLNDLSQLVQSEKKGLSFGMFLDAQGHMLRICSGCDKWHTGVIYLHRTASTTCMEAWRDVLITNPKFDTDQAAIDFVEQKPGKCSRAASLPSRHLLFAKDYIAWMLAPHRTFVHVTAAGRMETQDAFYRNFVVPSILKSTGLDSSHLGTNKKCLRPQDGN